MANKSNYNLETVNCCFCGSTKHSNFIKNAKELYIGFDEYFNIVRCSVCGLLFTNPRPTIETIGYFYPDKAYYYNVSLSDQSTLILKDKLLRNILANHYNYPFKSQSNKLITKVQKIFLKNRILGAHIPPYVKEGKILDIGCSWGGYLFKMQDLGWKVYGVEKNQKAVDFAKNELNLKNILCGNVHEVELEKNFFDVVRMGMVLEHMHNPVEIIKQISLLLKPHGLFVFNVPNASGLEMKVFGKNAYFLHVPQHLYHFTPQSIKNVLKKGNFKINKIVHHQTNKDWINSIKNADINFLTKLMESKAINTIVNLVLLKCLLKYTALMGKTSRMTIYAEKI